MVDALAPAVRALLESAEKSEETMAQAAHVASVAANNGALATKDMIVARAGRSAYVPQGSLAGNPDPGAVAVAGWLEAVATVLDGADGP